MLPTYLRVLQNKSSDGVIGLKVFPFKGFNKRFQTPSVFLRQKTS